MVIYGISFVNQYLPLFTTGIDEEYDFAIKLISSDVRELEYERLGSRGSEGAATLIDVYSFFVCDYSVCQHGRRSIYLVPSFNGQDDRLSARRPEFDSPWDRQISLAQTSL